MRKFRGLIVTVLIWVALTLALGAFFAMRGDLEQADLIASGLYMLFLLILIPTALPLHSYLLETLLVLYALTLGVVDMAAYLKMSHPVLNVLSPLMLNPFQGLFYLQSMDSFGLGRFAVHAVIGCFAAFLCLAAGVGACMVQPREWD